jgi:hypothetical protein
MLRSLSGPLAAAFLLVSGFASAASAQVFYEPVRYQYGHGDGTFYYGGHDPRVFSYARQDIRRERVWSRFTMEPVVQPLRVYSDDIPFVNLADNHSYTSYGSYTPADAHNEAYANVPRYFRKSDLLRAAVVNHHGDVVVPAHAKPVMDITVVRPFGTLTQPAVPKGTILIIPKEFFKKQPKQDLPSTAMAQ